jgi:hypothetical protein
MDTCSITIRLLSCKYKYITVLLHVLNSSKYLQAYMKSRCKSYEINGNDDETSNEATEGLLTLYDKLVWSIGGIITGR